MPTSFCVEQRVLGALFALLIESFAAAIFRDPSERIVSSFFWHKHAFSYNPLWFKPLFRALVLDHLDSMPLEAALATYSSLSSIQNCYTKMLTGQWCADPVAIGIEELNVALNNLKELEFVGIQNQWAASVCLFHAQFELKSVYWPFEGQNVRPGHYQDAFQGLDKKDGDLQRLLRANEKLDYDIYAKATSIFEMRVKEHPHCASFLVDVDAAG